MRRSPLLSIAAVLSLGAAAVLAFGYVGRVGVILDRCRPAGPPPAYVADDVRATDGRVVCYHRIAATMPAGVTLSPGPHLAWRCEWRPSIDLRRAVWEFDAHTLNATLTTRTDIYAAPIWCFEVPLLIAPLLWLRHNRRGRREPTGFSVVPPPA